MCRPGRGLPGCGGFGVSSRLCPECKSALMEEDVCSALRPRSLVFSTRETGSCRVAARGPGHGGCRSGLPGQLRRRIQDPRFLLPGCPRQATDDLPAGRHDPGRCDLRGPRRRSGRRFPRRHRGHYHRAGIDRLHQLGCIPVERTDHRHGFRRWPGRHRRDPDRHQGRPDH